MISRLKIFKLSLFLFASLALACTQNKTPTNPSAYRIDLKITYGESSKDSHEMRYEIDFDGSKVIYFGPYGECERGQCEHKKLQFGVDDEEIGKLEALLNQQTLLTSFSEIKKDRDTGNWVESSLSITRKKENWSISIEGMTSTWHPEKKELDLSKEALKKLEAITALQKLFTQFAKAYLPSAH